MKNRIQLLLLFIVILAQGNALIAQSLSGKVIDIETKAPIANAYIYESNSEIGQYTDKQGQFVFDNCSVNQSRLLISVTGYQSTVFTTTEKSGISIALTPLHVVLDEVIVSTPNSKLQGENITNITTLKLNDINQIKTNTIGEVLANVPGVYVASIGKGISKPVIRGLSGTRVVTYVDGLRIENQQWGGDHGIGASDLGIDRLEVIKGPSSLLYGSDAMGGVLYFVESNYMPKNNWKSFLSTNFESNSLSNLTQIGTQFTKNNSKFNLFLGSATSADYKLTNGYRVMDSRYSSQALKASYGYNKGRWVLNVRYNFSRSVIGIPGHSHKDSLYSELFYTKKINWAKILPFQNIINNFLTVENKFYFKKGYLLVQAGNTNNHLQEFEEKHTIPGLDMHLNSTTLNVRYAHKFSPSAELISGIQSMYQINSNGETAEDILIPNANTTDLGLYSIFYLGQSKFKAQAGIRGDYRQINLSNSEFTKQFNGINYALGGGYFGKKSIVRLNLSTGFRAPHTSEMLANGVHHGAFQYVIGDANLKTENATQLDLTYEYKHDHLSLIVNPFYNQINNFIFLQNQDSVITGYPVFNYVQNDLVHMYGFDLGVHYHPHSAHRLHLESSFSYIRAIDANGFHIDRIPPAKWQSKIKFEFDKKNKFYIKNIILQNNLILGQNELAIGEKASELYNILNIGINAIVHTKRNQIALNAGVKNVLNTTYIDHLSNLKYLDIAGPGINFYLGLKYNINHKKQNK